MAAGLLTSALVVIPAGIAEARPYVELKVRSHEGAAWVIEISITNVTEDTRVTVDTQTYADARRNTSFSANMTWWVSDSQPDQCVKKYPHSTETIGGIICDVKAGTTVTGAMGFNAQDGSGLNVRFWHDGIDWKFGRDQQRDNRPLVDPAPPNPQPGVPQVEVTTTFEDGHGPVVAPGQQVIAHIRIIPREISPDEEGIRKYDKPMDIEITVDGGLGTIDSVKGEVWFAGWDVPAEKYGPGGDCTWKYNWVATTAGDWYWGKCRYAPNRNSAWLDVRVVINSRHGAGWIFAKINGVDLGWVHAAANGAAGVQETPETPPIEVIPEPAKSPLEESFS